ncbi:MAG: hypothetical protein ACRC57_13740 [Sarcina sp.]
MKKLKILLTTVGVLTISALVFGFVSDTKKEKENPKKAEIESETKKVDKSINEIIQENNQKKTSKNSTKK